MRDLLWMVGCLATMAVASSGLLDQFHSFNIDIMVMASNQLDAEFAAAVL